MLGFEQSPSPNDPRLDGLPEDGWVHVHPFGVTWERAMEALKPEIDHTRQPDGTFRLTTELWVPSPIEEVFAFFSDAHNLEVLTPALLRFEVLTPAPIAMHPGTLIDYKLRLRGVPIRWRTEITQWDPPNSFVDTQLKGPYNLWHHTHRFEALEGGTRCEDEVLYRVFGGRLIQWLIVRRDVEAIFAYRQEQMARLFGADQRGV